MPRAAPLAHRTAYYRKRNPGLRVPVTKKADPRSHPASPMTSDAWLRLDAPAECPSGYHRSPGYRRLHTDRRYCVRDCDKWEPSRKTDKAGKCFKPSAWMILLADARKHHARLLSAAQGRQKMDLMKIVMKGCKAIYDSIGGKGNVTMESFAQFRQSPQYVEALSSIL